VLDAWDGHSEGMLIFGAPGMVGGGGASHIEVNVVNYVTIFSAKLLGLF